MDATPNLSFPYIMPSQAQEHVTHNELLRSLDVMIPLPSSTGIWLHHPHLRLMACPALMGGITKIDDNIGAVAGINRWLP